MSLAGTLNNSGTILHADTVNLYLGYDPAGPRWDPVL
jgi:hypothetical protein